MQLRYWNLIGKNSGLMFFLYAMVIIGGFYYKRWLDSLPGQFPGALLLCGVLAFLTVRSPIRTFTRRADLVFLLPVEARLGSYFLKSRIYSFLMQSLTMTVVLVIGAPLYFQTEGGSRTVYLLTAVAAFAGKWWNIDSRWSEMSIAYTLPLKLLRGMISFLFLYSVIVGMPWPVPLICLAVMLAASFYLFRRQAAGGLLDWERVLDMDNRLAMRFLHFANLFTDVPRLRHRVHPRKIISRLFPVRVFSAEHVYEQLFVKTFLRADDYLGIYMRLSLIGLAMCLFVHMGYYTVFVIVSVIFLTGLQLLPLWEHSFPAALEGLYPIRGSLRKRSFIRLIFILLTVQGTVMSLTGAAVLHSAAALLLFLSAAVATNMLFAGIYIKRKITEND